MSTIGGDVYTSPDLKVSHEDLGWKKIDPQIKKTIVFETCFYLGVSKNRGTSKWMVYNGSKPY